MKSPIVVRLGLALCFALLIHGCAKTPTADNPPELSAAEKAKFDAAAAEAAAKGAAAAQQSAPPAASP